MVKTASSPVTITVSSGGKETGSRSVGLTSPVPRASKSNNPNSPSPLGGRGNRRASSGGRYSSMSKDDPGEEMNSEFVTYTVHIPPTPDRPSISASQTSLNEDGKDGLKLKPERSFISGTIFTGGYNSVTRGHAIGCSSERPETLKLGSVCGMKGCDEKAIEGKCECGFKICGDCYLDCVGTGGGHCPGCKEPYKDVDDDDDDDEVRSEAEDRALPLPSKFDTRLSLVKSFKGQNHPPDFDHTRWLFETKGTYGYGNALWPKDGFGLGSGANGFENPPDFGERSKRPLTRKVGVSTAILSPYRLLIILRLVALGFFLTWRIRHPNREAMWLWGMSITCELWFAFSWILDQLPKLCPVNRVTDLSVLKERFESPNLRNPKGRSDLPGIDVFVSTADPEKEPPLVTANTILSILAVDYPVEKVACYLSDDGGALLTFEALAETASFARVWVPFCRKHNVEPRNPEAYFGQKRDFLKNKVRLDFVRERRRVKREYDEFKVRINSLTESIRRRSDAYNAHEELRAKKTQMEMGGNLSDPIKLHKATWMSDGSHWPGTWASAEPDHSKGDHAGIIQAMLAPPNTEPVYGTEADGENLIDMTEVDTRLPMLVYVSREKRPGYDHNKKAGAMNALVRTSAIMSNGPFILNLDCDHYIYNSLALREGLCFMLDRGGDRICYVQFPQRFEGIDPNDRYANHNTVFFDVSMRALDGLQGPMYVGTGCIFRRTALYGFSPPRATEHHGWFGRRKIKLLLRKPKATKKVEDEIALPINGEHNFDDDADIESLLLPKRFGNSTSLAASIPVAEYQGRLLQDVQGKGNNGRPAGSLAVPREPLDAATVAEAISVISCFYEDKTEWGKRVGWIYGSVTEDVVTGYRMHNRGWRSVYCVTKRDAFRGTAPINLTDRLHQVLRWATGSVEIFFSRNNALFATRRMKFLQRVAYFNVGMYPFTSMFLLVYCILPAVSLFSGQFIVQALSVTFLIFLLAITITLCLLAILEIKWSGITLHDWWRNEQFWLIGGTSAHPAAVLQGLLKVIAGVDISFTLTSKSATPEDGDDEFADLYVVKWSFLMVPPITIMMLNSIAIAVAIARTMYSPFPEWSKLLGGVFFSFWVLCHLYPFAKGLMGRRGKVPTIVFVWSGLLSIIVSLLWVYINPPSGSKDYMKFQFP
ncbi:CELLULOSE SYNTHASE LIKE D5, cellulose synthase-like D5, SALT OVERLY SENSITIVE 6 [Hibiscus trionum]|uniref:CELLULOSE SYNTHASE LIKE D5, cellulose synthase-like D5, SALT OVERLY SENSITIVE 6 n=1 Tax=Hibiscus trionum TaxID=183268 RepID=A0A9W7IPC9_HIBTR|nr:CELLULOSE SYNTHASE LIKE D5, cellulose synthase-like D5, SALT OVERLY SENSITIVE 6 [Hibiscus trionum]